MAGSHSWTYDAPTGVYKNHDLSSKLRMASIKEAKFAQFAMTETGYGKKKGESVTITRISNIDVPTSDVLVENERIPEDTVSLSTQALTVYERGRAIPYTSLAQDLAHFDLGNAIQMKLKDQMTLSMDAAAATAFKAGKIKAIPSGVSALTFDTDGTASTTATVNLNVYHLEELRDYIFSTINAKPFAGDDYVMIASTKACRGIKRDPKWEDFAKYTNPEKKFNSEIGRMEGIRFIESNNTSSLSATLGSGSVLGEAVLFGADPVAMGVVQDPELRAKESEDYGRSKGVAWYGIYGFEQIWDDSANAGEARVIHITSA